MFSCVSKPRLSILLASVAVFAVVSASIACPSQNPDAVELASTCPSHAPMHIPNWGLQASLKAKVATSSLRWASTTTWLNANGTPANRVPTATDVVLIPPGATITLDGGTALSSVLTIRGTLKFTRNASVTLRAATLLINYDGTLDMGRPANDGVAADRITGMARLQLGGSLLPKYYAAGSPTTLYTDTYNAAQPVPYDPRELGGGMIILGKFTAAGQNKTSFVRLQTAPAGGATTLTTTQSVQNWQNGDKLVLPDTRSPFRRQYIDGGVLQRNEAATFKQSSGTSVTLASKLLYAHPGNAEFAPHIADLTRNVVIESYNYQLSTAPRAHVMATGPAQVDIENVQFIEMGRTKTGVATDFDAATFGNQKGRYALHFHMMDGPFGAGAAGDNAYALSHLRGRVANCTFDNSFASASYTYPTKWQLTLHGTTRVQVTRNVFYGATGAAVVTEDGNEGWNEITGNFALSVRGSLPNNAKWTPATSDGIALTTGGITIDPVRTDARIRGSEGVGFWLSGDADMVWNNVAADCALTGVLVFPRLNNGSDPLGMRSNMPFPTDSVEERGTWVKWSSPGADHLAYGWQSGDIAYVRDRSTNLTLYPAQNPYGENEIYGCLEGIEKWGAAPVTVRATTVWNCQNAIEPWQSAGDTDSDSLTIDGLVARGDGNAQAMLSTQNNWEPTMGINNRFHIVTGRFRNLDISDFQIAVRTSTPTGKSSVSLFAQQLSTAYRMRDVVIENLTARCPIGVLVQADLHYKVDMINGVRNTTPARSYVRNARFFPPTIGGKVTAVQSQLYAGLGMDVRANAADEVYLDQIYLGNATTPLGSFRLYYPEQAADFLYPIIGQVSRGGLNDTAPRPNSVAWNQSVNDTDGRKAWMGEVAPANATAYQDANFAIAGLLVPISSATIAAKVQSQPQPIWYDLRILADHVEGFAWNLDTPFIKGRAAIYVDGKGIGIVDVINAQTFGAGVTRRVGFAFNYPLAVRQAAGLIPHRVQVVLCGADGIAGTADDMLIGDSTLVLAP